MAEVKDILQEYVATANNPKYKSDWNIINSKFPELKGYDAKLLQEYVATANNPQYKSNFQTINSKFPELFSQQQQAIQPKQTTTNGIGVLKTQLPFKAVTDFQQSIVDLAVPNKNTENNPIIGIGTPMEKKKQEPKLEMVYSATEKQLVPKYTEAPKTSAYDVANAMSTEQLLTANNDVLKGVVSQANGDTGLDEFNQQSDKNNNIQAFNRESELYNVRVKTLKERAGNLERVLASKYQTPDFMEQVKSQMATVKQKSQQYDAYVQSRSKEVIALQTELEAIVEQGKAGTQPIEVLKPAYDAKKAQLDAIQRDDEQKRSEIEQLQNDFNGKLDDPDFALYSQIYDKINELSGEQQGLISKPEFAEYRKLLDEGDKAQAKKDAMKKAYQSKGILGKAVDIYAGIGMATNPAAYFLDNGEQVDKTFIGAKIADEGDKLLGRTLKALASVPKMLDISNPIGDENKYDVFDKMFDQAVMFSKKRDILNPTATDVQRDIIQKYADVDGYRVMLDENGKPTNDVRDDKFRNINDKTKKEITDKYNENPTAYKTESDFSFSTLTTKATPTILDMGTMMATAALTGGSSAVMVGTAAAQMYGDMYESGLNAGLTPQEANDFATLTSIMTGMVTLVNPMEANIVKGTASKSIGKFISNSISKADVQLIRSGEMSIGQYAKRMAKEGTKNVFGENAEEIVFEPAVQRATETYYNTKAQKNGQQGFEDLNKPFFDTKQTIETAMITTMASLLMTPIEVANSVPEQRKIALQNALDNPQAFIDLRNSMLNSGDVSQEKFDYEVKAFEEISKQYNTVKPNIKEDLHDDLAELLLKKYTLKNTMSQVNDEVLNKKNQLLLDDINKRLEEVADGTYNKGKEKVLSNIANPNTLIEEDKVATYNGAEVTILDDLADGEVVINTNNPEIGEDGIITVEKSALTDVRNKPKDIEQLQITSAVININGKEYEGKNHAEAILKAQADGQDISQVDRQAEGLFKLSDGTIINREQAKEQFGKDRSELIIPQDEVSNQANVEYKRIQDEQKNPITPVEPINTGQEVDNGAGIQQVNGNGGEIQQGSGIGQVGGQEVPTEKVEEGVTPGLKDVESTDKALEGVDTFHLVENEGEWKATTKTYRGREIGNWAISNLDKKQQKEYLKIRDEADTYGTKEQAEENLKKLKDFEQKNKEAFERAKQEIDALKEAEERKAEERKKQQNIFDQTEQELNKLSDKEFDKLVELIDEKRRQALEQRFGDRVEKRTLFRTPISESYHKAKADGSNPELVKAVEEALTPTPEVSKPVSEVAEKGEGRSADVMPTNAWGSKESIDNNFYTKDENGFAVKIPLDNVDNVNIDGVDFHVSKVDGDWKVIEKNSGLEVSTGKLSNTKKSAIEDATYRINNNGGGNNIPTLSERAIKQFTDSNLKLIETPISKTETTEQKLKNDKHDRMVGLMREYNSTPTNKKTRKSEIRQSINKLASDLGYTVKGKTGDKIDILNAKGKVIRKINITSDEVTVTPEVIEKTKELAQGWFEWNGNELDYHIDASQLGLTWQEIRRAKADIDAGKTESTNINRVANAINEYGNMESLPLVRGFGGNYERIDVTGEDLFWANKVNETTGLLSDYDNVSEGELRSLKELSESDEKEFEQYSDLYGKFTNEDGSINWEEALKYEQANGTTETTANKSAERESGGNDIGNSENSQLEKEKGVNKTQNHQVYYNGKVVDMGYITNPKEQFKYASQRISDNLGTGGNTESVGYVKTPDGKIFEVSRSNKSAKLLSGDKLISAQDKFAPKDADLQSTAKSFTPIDKTAFEKLLDKLKKVFPNVKVELFGKGNMESAKKALEKYGVDLDLQSIYNIIGLSVLATSSTSQINQQPLITNAVSDNLNLSDGNVVEINDNRLIDKASGNKITDKNKMSASVTEGDIKKLTLLSNKHGVDPYTMIAMTMQETNFDTGLENPFHYDPQNWEKYKGISEDPMEIAVLVFKDKLKYAERLGKKTEAEKIQAYNGYGKIGKKTDAQKGSSVRSWYGISSSSFPIDMNKTPIYGNRVLDIRDNIIKSNPKIVKLVESQSNNIAFLKTKDGTIYGFKTPDGKVFINTDNLNANTPIHEFGHIWQSVFPQEFARGIELLKLSPQGQALIREIQKNPAYKGKSLAEIQAEALVTAIGNKGEAIFNSNPTLFNKFKEWLSDFFKKLGDKLGIKDLSADDKLNMFTKKVVGELLGGKVLDSKVGTEKSTEKTITFQGQNIKVKEINGGAEVINGFYSPLEKIINETKFEKLPAKQWLEKFGKGEEAKWTGLADWLAQQTGSVSKAEIQQFLKDNRIQVVEVVKDGGISEEEIDTLLNDEVGQDMTRDEARAFLENDERQDDTKFSQYQLEGEKSNYKEVLVTMPVARSKQGYVVEQDYRTPNTFYAVNQKTGVKLKFGSYELAKSQAERLSKESQPDFDKQFKSSHFDEPNILVHLRMNTRTDAEGNKVLFLEEVQSDWGQKGKKEGFKDSEASKKEKLLYDLGGDYIAVRKGYGVWSDATKEQKQNELNRIKNRLESNNLTEDDLVKSLEKWGDRTLSPMEGTPTAPFITDTNAWTKLALKVALKEAVKQGADKIAWTTGEQQNDRYDLQKQVDFIDVFTNDDGTYHIVAVKGNNTISEEKSLKENQLEGLLGKDLTNKIIEDTKNHTHREGEENLVKTYRGKDLSVGGKGMKGFYGSPYQFKSTIKVNKDRINFTLNEAVAEVYFEGGVISEELPTWAKNEIYLANIENKGVKGDGKIVIEELKEKAKQLGADILTLRADMGVGFGGINSKLYKYYKDLGFQDINPLNPDGRMYFDLRKYESKGSLGIVGNVAKSLFKQEPKTVGIEGKKDFKNNERIKYLQHFVDELPQLEKTVSENKLPFTEQELDNSIEKGSITNESYKQGIKQLKKYEESVAKYNEYKERVDEYSKLKFGTTQHSIDITPEMKAMVEFGQPLFQILKDAITDTDKKIIGEAYDKAQQYLETTDFNFDTDQRDAFIEEIKNNPALKAMFTTSQLEKIYEAQPLSAVDKIKIKYKLLVYNLKANNSANKAGLKQQQKQMVADITALIKGNLGGITGKQAERLTNLATTAVEKNSTVRLGKIINQIANLADQRTYQKAKTLYEVIKARSKRKGGVQSGKLTGVLQDFATINPLDVSDIAKYVELAEKVKQASNVVKQPTDADSDLVYDEVQAYVKAQQDEINSNAINDTLEDDAMTFFTVLDNKTKAKFGDDKTFDDLNEAQQREVLDSITKDDIKKYGLTDEERDMVEAFKEIKTEQKRQDFITATYVKIGELKDLLANSVGVITQSPAEKEITDALLNVKLDDMTATEMARVLKLINGITQNNDYSGGGAFVAQQKSVEVNSKMNTLKSEIGEFRKLSEGGSKFRNFQQISVAMAKGKKLGAKLMEASGINNLMRGIAKTKTYSHNLQKAFKAEKFKSSVFEPISQMRQSIYAAVIQTKIGDDVKEAEHIERWKRIIEKNIENLRTINKDGYKEQAELLQKALDEVIGDRQQLKDIADNMSKVDSEGKRVVQFFTDNHAEQKPRFRENSLLFHNKEIEEYNSYTKLSITSLTGDTVRDTGEKLMNDARSTGITKKKSKSMIDRANYESLNDNTGLDFNFINKQMKALGDNEYDINTSADITTLANAFNSDNKQLRELLGAENFDLLKKRLQTIVGTSKYEETTVVDDLLNEATKISRTIALGSITQVLKQSTVLMSTYLNSAVKGNIKGLDFTMLFGSKRQKENLQKLFAQSEIGARRAEGAGGYYDNTTIKKNISDGNAKKILKAIGKGKDFFSDLSMYPLRSFDILAADISWITFYKKYLRDNNLTFDENNEFKNPNKEAMAYAETMVQTAQGANTEAGQAEVWGSAKGLTQLALPFMSFAVQAKARLVDNVMNIYNGDDRVEAGRDIGAYVTEQIAFNAVKLGIGTVVATQLIPALLKELGLGDDDEDTKGLSKIAKEKIELEKLRKAEQIKSSFVNNIVQDLTYGTIPMVDNMATKPAINYVYDRLYTINYLYKYVFKTDKNIIPFNKTNTGIIPEYNRSTDFNILSGGTVGVGYNQLLNLKDDINIITDNNAFGDYKSQSQVSVFTYNGKDYTIVHNGRYTRRDMFFNNVKGRMDVSNSSVPADILKAFVENPSDFKLKEELRKTGGSQDGDLQLNLTDEQKTYAKIMLMADLLTFYGINETVFNQINNKVRGEMKKQIIKK